LWALIRSESISYTGLPFIRGIGPLKLLVRLVVGGTYVYPSIGGGEEARDYGERDEGYEEEAEDTE